LRRLVNESTIAEEFINEGLLRNAAGKAFEAWKALLGATLVDNRDELLKIYPSGKLL
jgi:hypothetical protein